MHQLIRLDLVHSIISLVATTVATFKSFRQGFKTLESLGNKFGSENLLFSNGNVYAYFKDSGFKKIRNDIEVLKLPTERGKQITAARFLSMPLLLSLIKTGVFYLLPSEKQQNL